MRLSPIGFLTLLGAGVAAVVVGVTLSARATSDLRNRVEHAGAEQRSLHALRQERDALSARQPATAELEQLVRDQAALDAERAALEKRRVEFQSAALEAMRRTSPPDAPSREPSSRATPDATLHSVIRAVTDGEAAELAGLIDFDPSARTEAENFFASLPPDLRTQYGSPEQLVAHVMAAKTGTILSAVAAVPDFQGPDDASMRTSLKLPHDNSRTATLQFHRDAGGWKLRVPAKVIEGYRARVTGVVFADTASAPAP